jgi:hypothetical protein
VEAPKKKEEGVFRKRDEATQGAPAGAMKKPGRNAELGAASAEIAEATRKRPARRDVSMPSNRSRQEGTQTELDVGSLLEGLDQERQALQRTIRRDLDAQAHQEASEQKRVQTAMSSEAGAFASNLHRDLDKLVGAAARNGEVAAKEAAKAEVAAKEAARAEKQAEKDAIKAEKQDARQEASEEQQAQQAIERKVDAVADAADQKFADVERQEIAGRKDLQVALRRRASEKSHFHWPVAIMVVLLLLLVSRARRNRQSQLSPSASTVVEPLLGESRHPDDVVRERLDLEHKVAAQNAELERLRMRHGEAGSCGSGSASKASRIECPARLEEGINPHICVTDSEEDRRIEIMCPGVPVQAISLRRLPNGVRVEIKGGIYVPVVGRRRGRCHV